MSTEQRIQNEEKDSVAVIDGQTIRLQHTLCLEIHNMGTFDAYKSLAATKGRHHWGNEVSC